ncbi:M20 metallopeptidase family protein [Leucobacter triazinivorans]|uniref:Amidohydrolase n=1 Tax=Leucobacter triazinivorans TaxID=1784719 RepID=A0A4P6KER9_9MICO|nr:M20 family metallopeptidase [Leucobacter triazinivorans]QBE48772.1 amidohydrolase [Leucobacter triazinivorans]
METQSISAPDFIDEARVYSEQLVSLRRVLHGHAEIGLDLPNTQAAVLDALADLDLEVRTGRTLSSVVAVLRGARPGPTVLLRGDMDALPIREETGLTYASTNGAMHACGHDLHVAGLVGAARLLSEHRDELRGNVIFMFQPGEEGYYGARVMLEEGVLDAAGERPVAAYGIHVHAGLPRGVFTTRPGSMLAGFSNVTIEVHGVGGHSSSLVTTRNPVTPAAEIASSLNTMATHTFESSESVVLAVTRMEGSSAVNIIPEVARIEASVRMLSPENAAQLEAGCRRLAEGIAAAHGCTAEVTITHGYPVTVNHPDETDMVLATLNELVGPDRTTVMTEPKMGCEDFAYVLEKVPGTYIMLGAAIGDGDAASGEHHSSSVKFDDSVLSDQAAALAAIAWQRLNI